MEGHIELISCLPNQDWITVWIGLDGLSEHEYFPWIIHAGGYVTNIAPKSVNNGRPTLDESCDGY